MTEVEKFVSINRLQPADAILLRKKFFGMVDHYAIFLGHHTETYTPYFIANYTEGVKALDQHEVGVFLQKLEPTKIERFVGGEAERSDALRRAYSMIGKKTYNLLSNNCEHFKNYVHFNKKYSTQVEAAGTAAIIGGGVAAISGAVAGNSKVVGWGLLFLALGALAVAASDQDD